MSDWVDIVSPEDEWVDVKPAPTPRQAGLATTFGYNDAQDNGIGAWGDRTNNPDIVGVSLPIRTLREHFGDENKAHGALVEVSNPETGKTILAPIVDKGPADWVIARQGPTIDLTEGARRELGAGGKSKMEWKIVGHDDQSQWEDINAGEQARPQDQNQPKESDWVDVGESQPEEGAPVTPAKREVGAIESAYRGAKSSALGLSETIARHGMAPFIHGVRQAIEAVEPDSPLSKFAQNADDSFWKRFVSDVDKQREDLAFDPNTEVRTLAGQKGKAADFAGEASEAVGGIAPDIGAAVVTGGATVAPKSLVAGLGHSAGIFTLPAARNGMDAAKREERKGGSEVDQFKAFIKGMLETQAMAAIPMNVESKLASIPARVASRAAQGGALGVATGEAFRQGENIIGDKRDFELKRAAIDALVPGILGGAFGRNTSTPREAAPVKAAEAAKSESPTAGIVASPKAVEGFKTSQGSTYKLDGDKTTRTKTKHAGHDPKDVGLKEQSQRTIYVTPEQGREIGMHQSLSSKNKGVIVFPDGTLLLVSHNEKANKLGRDSQPIPFTTTPEVGRSPLELWKGKESGVAGGKLYLNWHPGNEIVELTQGKESQIGATLGIVANPNAAKGAELTRSVGGRIIDFLGKPQKATDFLRTIIHDTAARQKSGFDVTKQTVALEKTLPARKLEAIGMFLDEGGDLTSLAKHAKSAKDLKARRAYEDALKLTPEELAIARQIKGRYQSLLKEGQDAGLDIPERQNYITHLLHNANPLQGISNTRSLSSYFRFAKKRSYNTFFDAIQDGAKPKTFNSARILAVYETVLKDAIHNKKLTETLQKTKMEDGREALVPLKKKMTDDYKDYRTLTEVPGLEYMAIHPDAYKNIKAIFKKSLVREWWNTPSDNPLHEASKGLTRLLFDEIQQTAKGTMFSLSFFHQGTEGVHLLGHRVSPKPSIAHGELSFDDPRVAKAAKAGVMISPDRLSQQYFLDGLGTNSKNLVTRLGRKLGKPGEVVSDMIDGYTQYLFESYIPRAKIDLFHDINERNQKRYAKEIKDGKYTPYDIEVLSADQTNVALGHLNYARMGRSQTVQHLLQMALLAPDFLEARARFAGQAARSAFGKVGREQLTALAVLGIGQYTLARMLNQATHGDPEWDSEHPFEVKVTLPNGHERWVGLRSVPEDAYKFFHDPGQFMRSRLAAWPTVATDMVSGRNWMGEKSSAGKALTDMIGNTVPLPLRGFTEKFFNADRASTLSLGEHFLKSAGLTVSRYSPISRAYGLAEEWKKKSGIKADEGLYPPSKYAQLRFALEDGDWDLAKAEAKKLGTDAGKGFHRSITHPFTGSTSNDKRMYDSLDKEDKKVFDAAIRRRSVIISRYNQHVGQMGKPMEDTEFGMLEKIRKAKIKASLDLE